jgi:RecA-family ATPase
MPTLNDALNAIAAGLSPTPTRDKVPILQGWQAGNMTEARARSIHATWQDGIGIVCGAPSGNLECLDFDMAGECLGTWTELVEAEAPGLLNRIPLEQTPSGGYHVPFRRPGPVPKNRKLAERLVNGKPKELIETRGTGGQFVTAPTSGYRWVQGGWGAIPTLTEAEAETLIRAAKACNEYVKPEKVKSGPREAGKPSGVRPGDDFNARGDVLPLLERAGWQICGQHGVYTHFTRPGKNAGVSASLIDGKVFHCFTSNGAPFEPEEAYSPHGVLAELEYGGDYKAAAKALYAEGYGDRVKPEERQTRQERTQEPEEPVHHSCFHELDLAQFTAGRARAEALPDLEWTFPDFLLTHNVALLIGLPGTGKSYFANQLASYVASGRGVAGIFKDGGKRGKVLVLAGEEDRRIVPRRVRALADALFPDERGNLDFNRDQAEYDFNENMIVVPLAGKSLRLLDKDGPGAPTKTQVFTELMALCKSIENLQLVIIDPQSRFYGLDENDNSAATEYMTALEELSQETGASIICIHHIGKGGKKWDDALTAYAARGASGFVGAVRAQMNLVTLTKEEAKSVIAPAEDPERDGEYLALAFPKCSYAPSRPYVFLRRADGGFLTAVEPAAKSEADLKTEATILLWIKAKIAEQAEQGRPSLTVKALRDFSAEWGGIFGATRTKVVEVANAAICNGDLFLEQRKNRMGRQCEYLCLTDEKTGEKHRPEKTGETPADTGQKKRPECNTLEQQELLGEKTPAEENTGNGNFTCKKVNDFNKVNRKNTRPFQGEEEAGTCPAILPPRSMDKAAGEDAA